jgi:hypothetical protein
MKKWHIVRRISSENFMKNWQGAGAECWVSPMVHDGPLKVGKKQ